jgi:hypothetical protein
MHDIARTLFGRQVGVHLGQPELGRVGQQSGVAAEPGALAEIVRFGVQLAFRLPQQRSDIQAALGSRPETRSRLATLSTSLSMLLADMRGTGL